jgi:hypothetical protein
MTPDIRCHHRTSDNAGRVRCQLLAGHVPPHAALAATVNGGRELWRWRDGDLRLDVRPYQSELGAGLPWAPGEPRVAHPAA